MSETSKRVGLIFNKFILSETQLKDGLKRSWLLLNPQLATISDVVSYILHSFDLYDSCPLGLILSMDNFVLPPFESTSILKDKDVISVKRKGTRLVDTNKETEEAKNLLEDEIIEKQPLPSVVKLLANVEFNEEMGGYNSESDDGEDEVAKSTIPVQNASDGGVASKKRKTSSRIESMTKKRPRQKTPETIEKKAIENCEHITPPRKKKKHSNKLKRDVLSSSGIREKRTKDMEPEANSGDLENFKENGEKTTQATNVPERTKKVSRSSKRKMTQRKFKRMSRGEYKGDEKCKLTTSILEQTNEYSDGEGDLVPVVIRPGHIRFTSSRTVKDFEQNQAVQSTKNDAWDKQPTSKDSAAVNHSQETSRWSGITNKRKGKKWGREKQQTSTWKDSGDNNAPSSSTWAAIKQPNISWKESRDSNGHSSAMWDVRKNSSSSWKGSKDFNGQSSNTWATRNQPLDFDKLVPLIDEPKAGDIVAYRLLELSSTWCPELSSFRVGKITSFESKSNKILLVPVPEYPLYLEKKADEDNDYDGPPVCSVYSEDGSLEIDFPSLADVRIMQRGDLSQSECTKIPAAYGKSEAIEVPTANGNAVPSSSNYGAQNGSMTGASNISNQELPTPTTANGKKDVWEEISDALAAKKSQLTPEDKWNKKAASSKQSWSYRTLRGSAIGPTMAMLRAQNGV